MSLEKMVPRIEILSEKKLVGKRIKMSFSNNRTGELWQTFMPVRRYIKNNIGTELYSIEVYKPKFFDHFNPETEFDKWAAIEVTSFDTVPEGMEVIILPGGLYAVFVHKGPASIGPGTYQYIFATWLPASGFILDNRPHFAIMGSNIKMKTLIRKKKFGSRSN